MKTRVITDISRATLLVEKSLVLFYENQCNNWHFQRNITGGKVIGIILRKPGNNWHYLSYNTGKKSHWYYSMKTSVITGFPEQHFWWKSHWFYSKKTCVITGISRATLLVEKSLVLF